MRLLFADRVKETTATTGTGAYTLAGAVSGFASFDDAVDLSGPVTGETLAYCVTDGTDWEVGYGVYTVSGRTLARTQVLSSSNAGAAVSWAAGSKDVFVAMPAFFARFFAVDLDPAWIGNLSQVPALANSASCAMGPSASADGSRAMALGHNSNALGAAATALGENADAQGINAVAIGKDAQVLGDAGVALGQGSSSQSGGVGIAGDATGGGVAIKGTETANGVSIKAGSASAYGACAIGGDSNTVSGKRYAFSRGAFGRPRFALSDTCGADTQGLTQRHFGMLWNITSNATPTLLELDANAATNGYMTFTANRAMAFSGRIVARSSAGDCAMWEFKGLLKTDASNNPSFVGTPTVASVAADAGAASWAVALQVNTTNDCIDVQVTGAAATNISWSADFWFTERGTF